MNSSQIQANLLGGTGRPPRLTAVRAAQGAPVLSLPPAGQPLCGRAASVIAPLLVEGGDHRGGVLGRQCVAQSDE